MPAPKPGTITDPVARAVAQAANGGTLPADIREQFVHGTLTCEAALAYLRGQHGQ